MNKLNPILGYILAAALFIVGLGAMLSNFGPMFTDVETDMKSGRTLVFNSALPADSLKKLFTTIGYFEDPVDARLAAGWLSERLAENGTPENLGTLNRPSYKIPAKKALAEGGEEFRGRVEADYQNLGMDEDWRKAQSQQLGADFGNGAGLITVNVRNAKSIPNAPLSGITVRLRRHRLDSVTINGAKEEGRRAEVVTELVGFAKTDASGQARFHVEPGGSYSVVPIAEGYQYGREKGTTATGRLESSLTLNFRQQEHKLTPLPSFTYQAIKADKALIVRSPGEFKDSLMTGAAIYLLGWLAFLMFVMIRDRRMSTRSDYNLIITIMVLTGVGLLCMFAMSNPLADRNYGYDMATALGFGLVVMALTSAINLSKYFNSKSKVQLGMIPFDPIDRIAAPLRRKRSLERSSGFSFSTGFTYLLLAVVLIVLLGMFGTGPEGSDARVNLGGFQPSELCKYLILVFVAAFFAENSLLIQAFSQKLTSLTARRKLGVIAVVVAVMIGLMMLYLLVLSDMGPALIVLITFIFLYSMARRDFAQLLLGLITFIGLMLLARAINNTPVTLGIAAALWFVCWIAYGWIAKRQIYESAIIVNLLIVVFSLGGPILSAMGAESEAARLTNRTNMAWGGQWDNDVLGGDQVAQGIWSAATGGSSGMGLGNASASLVPAFHTDMAFTSAGEMLGLLGLVLIILCFVVLIHRSLLIGRRAGQPFTMYLVMGIALLTGVQFLFIVFGSLGIVPLSGVTVPFLSYSRTALITTLAAFGLVIGASRVRATESQRKYALTLTGPISASVLLFIIGALVIIGVLANYQIINREPTLIRPAYITNTAGARIIEYNPRIRQVLRALHAGNIYDTNGLLLATSSRDSLTSAIRQITPLGIDASALRKEAHKRKARYYTMGDQMLFMLGDAGTGRVLDYVDANPIGLLAEKRFEGRLRGIDIPERRVQLESDNYRENRFMPGMKHDWPSRERDYTNLLPFLNYGIYRNPLIEEFNAPQNRERRDMVLTVDARLQKQLQDLMEQVFSGMRARRPYLRASIVVLNAKTGDLLSSANYPMPVEDTIAMLNETRQFGDLAYERTRGRKPYTQRDLGMTYFTQPGSVAKVMTALAALRKFGDDGANQVYTFPAQEGIEGAGEPSSPISMERAIQHSSNNYFINYLHDKNLYNELGDIYEAVGARIDDNKKGVQPQMTYFFNVDELGNSNAFRSGLSSISSRALSRYQTLVNPQYRPKTTNKQWRDYIMAMAWGQGALRATPLMMARVASIVANEGKLAPTRYVKSFGGQTEPYAKQIDIVGASQAARLRGFMQLEAQRHGKLPNHPGDPKSIGGKTGTPQRPLHGRNVNDAWYIAFLWSNKLNTYLAVALRMERAVSNSSEAHPRMNDIVIPALNATGYQIY